MRFDFLSIAALAAVLTSARAQQCPEASRFGTLTVSPTALIPGQTFTITTNLTCAVRLDDTPTYLDYYIVGVSTIIHNGPILLARRTYDNSTSPPIDTFLARIPVWTFDPNGAYSVSVSNSFARLGPTGESVISVGSISAGINITSTGTPTPNQYIHPNANSASCLTAASNADGAVVKIEDCISEGSNSQSWTISGSRLQIFGNKCLDVTGGATADGSKMQIWTCTADDTSQEWTLSGSTIHWSGHASCLDLTGGSVTDGNIMQIWTCTGGGNQEWTRTTGPGSGTTLPPTTGHTISPGASATTCLTAATNVNGGTVVVEPCNGSAGQSWTLNGQTIIVYGSMCLDVTGGSITHGVKMQIWSCTPGAGDANQHFTTARTGIQWENMGECLDLTDGSFTSGNQVQVWPCGNGNTNQVWTIV